MSSANKHDVSLAVLLLPSDSLCQRQTRKCHLSADSCLCRAHTGTCRENPAAPHMAQCTAKLSTDPQTCHALPWQHFSIYLNRAGAQRVPGKLLHSAPFREDLSLGKEDNEAVFLLCVFKPALSSRHGNGWIGLNELSLLSVKLRSVRLFLYTVRTLNEDNIWAKFKREINTNNLGLNYVIQQVSNTYNSDSQKYFFFCHA